MAIVDKKGRFVPNVGLEFGMNTIITRSSRSRVSLLWVGWASRYRDQNEPPTDSHHDSVGDKAGTPLPHLLNIYA